VHDRVHEDIGVRALAAEGSQQPDVASGHDPEPPRLTRRSSAQEIAPTEEQGEDQDTEA